MKKVVYNNIWAIMQPKSMHVLAKSVSQNVKKNENYKWGRSSKKIVSKTYIFWSDLI